MAFVEAIASAPTAWSAVVALLGHYNAAEAPQTARRSADSAYEAWADLVARVEDAFVDVDPLGALNDTHRSEILQLTSNGEDYRAVEAVAWGIDCVTYPSFARAWRETCSASIDGTYRLRAGDIYPVPEAEWPWLSATQSLGSRPASLTTTLIGELPHVRVHQDSSFEVTVDFRVDSELEHLLYGLTHVASAHPNDDSTEISYPRPTPAIVFPIAPSDSARQAESINQLLDLALAGDEDDPSIIVIPELAVTKDLADEVIARVTETTGTVLVIVGSWHETLGGVPRNVTAGVLPEYGAALTHSKIFPLTSELDARERAWKEGIATPERGEITIYTGDRYRLALLICKDYLDRTLAEALGRLGANVILVPTMSPKTDAYAARAAAHAVDSQAFSLIAVGPLTWNGNEVGPISVLGVPRAGTKTLEVFRDEGVHAPLLVRFDLPGGSARVQAYH